MYSPHPHDSVLTRMVLWQTSHVICFLLVTTTVLRIHIQLQSCLFGDVCQVRHLSGAAGPRVLLAATAGGLQSGDELDLEATHSPEPSALLPVPGIALAEALPPFVPLRSNEQVDMKRFPCWSSIKPDQPSARVCTQSNL